MKKHETNIIEFTVIAPTNDLERIGEKIELTNFGEYCSDNSLRGYSLLHLLDHPAHYRVSRIMMRGKFYEIPPEREKNFAPSHHPETMKYLICPIQKKKWGIEG